MAKQAWSKGVSWLARKDADLKDTDLKGRVYKASHRCKGSADRSFVAQVRAAKLRTLMLDSESITAHLDVMDTAEPDLLENGVLHFPAWTSTTCGSRHPVLTSSRLNLARKVATLSTMKHARTWSPFEPTWPERNAAPRN